MTQREEIGHALYLLRAGSDPDTFLRTLRAYVLQHTETTEQMAELLQDLASVNPPAFVEALQTLAGRPLSDGWSIESVHKAKPRKQATAQQKKKRTAKGKKSAAESRLT